MSSLDFSVNISRPPGNGACRLLRVRLPRGVRWPSGRQTGNTSESGTDPTQPCGAGAGLCLARCGADLVSLDACQERKKIKKHGRWLRDSRTRSVVLKMDNPKRANSDRLPGGAKSKEPTVDVGQRIAVCSVVGCPLSGRGKAWPMEGHYRVLSLSPKHPNQA